MVSIWKTFRSMRDGRCRESGRSSEARCREVPLYSLSKLRFLNLLVVYIHTYRYGLHLLEMMMSLLQEVEGLTKELCFIIFPVGRPVSMQNFRLNVYTVYLF